MPSPPPGPPPGLAPSAEGAPAQAVVDPSVTEVYLGKAREKT